MWKSMLNLMMRLRRLWRLESSSYIYWVPLPTKLPLFVCLFVFVLFFVCLFWFFLGWTLFTSGLYDMVIWYTRREVGTGGPFLPSPFSLPLFSSLLSPSPFLSPSFSPSHFSPFSLPLFPSPSPLSPLSRPLSLPPYPISYTVSVFERNHCFYAGDVNTISAFCRPKWL